MRLRSLWTLLLCVTAVAQVANQQMTPSANGQYIVSTITGRPVFVVGEDGFGAAVNLTGPQLTQYLTDRSGRGFNLIWIVAVDNIYSPTPPNNNAGQAPFTGGDFNTLNAPYWSHIDAMMTQAASLNITVALNVAFIGFNSGQGWFADWNGGVSGATLSNYCTALANRYKTAPNLVWLLGGDFDPTNATVKTNIANCSAAIAAADTNHIITIETCRSCSPANQSTYDSYSGVFPTGVDLNWVYNTQPTLVAGSQSAFTHQSAIMPVMGEDWYSLENSTTEFQVRQEGWWAVLSGTNPGRLYGSGAIWSFDSVNGSTCCTSGTPTWQSQLSSVSSLGQQYLGQLMNTREFYLCAPDTTHVVVTANFGSGSTLTTTCRTTDGQTIISYFSDGNATAKTVDMSKITSTASVARAWWFNPQTGAYPTLIGTFANSGTRNFTAPDANDWVLVIDDAVAGLLPPGIAATTAVTNKTVLLSRTR